MYKCFLLFFVYFVSITRGLNRYDFERLLSGFVVCAVHIYITERRYCMLNPEENAREKETKNSERSDDVCCVAKRIPYILTHIPANPLTSIFTHAVSKQASKRASEHASEQDTKRETRERQTLVRYESSYTTWNATQRHVQLEIYIYTPVNRLRIATGNLEWK